MENNVTSIFKNKDKPVSVLQKILTPTYKKRMSDMKETLAILDKRIKELEAKKGYSND